MQVGRMIAGAIVGGLVGLAFGFAVYMVLRELVLPTSLWSSDGVMWAIMLIVAAPIVTLAIRRGARPSRATGGGLRIIAGLALGLVAGAAIALALSVAAAIIFNISQMEGAYAMAVAFVYVPLGALIGAIVGAVMAGSRRKPVAGGGTSS